MKKIHEHFILLKNSSVLPEFRSELIVNLPLKLREI